MSKLRLSTFLINEYVWVWGSTGYLGQWKAVNGGDKVFTRCVSFCLSLCLCAQRRDVIMIMTSLHCHYVTSRLCTVCDVTSSNPASTTDNIRKERILVNYYFYYLLINKIHKMRLNYYLVKNWLGGDERLLVWRISHCSTAWHAMHTQLLASFI